MSACNGRSASLRWLSAATPHIGCLHTHKDMHALSSRAETRQRGHLLGASAFTMPGSPTAACQSTSSNGWLTRRPASAPRGPTASRPGCMIGFTQGTVKATGCLGAAAQALWHRQAWRRCWTCDACMPLWFMRRTGRLTLSLLSSHGVSPAFATSAACVPVVQPTVTPSAGCSVLRVLIRSRRTACQAGVRRSTCAGGSEIAAARLAQASGCQPDVKRAPDTYSAPVHIVTPALSHPRGPLFALGERVSTQDALTVAWGLRYSQMIIVPETQTLGSQCAQSYPLWGHIEDSLVVRATVRRNTARTVPSWRQGSLERAKVDMREARRD